MPRDHLMPLVTQAAEALDFLNTCQHYVNGQWVTLQHCDVTPSNLLVFHKTVKLSDFGLTTTLTSREKPHHRAGTPAYAGPEVFQAYVSERTDQYALAVSYCALRSGRLPFPDTPETFEPWYIRPEPDLTMLDPEERPAVLRALTPVPPDRWPSCGDFVAELARATAVGPAPVPHLERRRNPRYRADAAVSCHVLATLGNQAWRAELKNISVGGVRMRIAKPGCALRSGRLLEVALVRAAVSLRVTMRLRLTNCVEQEGGDYEVGGTFDHPLNSAELQALSVGEQANGTAADGP
jgi:serine/threonine-protein kinase